MSFRSAERRAHPRANRSGVHMRTRIWCTMCSRSHRAVSEVHDQFTDHRPQRFSSNSTNTAWDAGRVFTSRDEHACRFDRSSPYFWNVVYGGNTVLESRDCRGCWKSQLHRGKFQGMHNSKAHARVERLFGALTVGGKASLEKHTQVNLNQFHRDKPRSINSSKSRTRVQNLIGVSSIGERRKLQGMYP
jgi:hypothetical protein